MDRRAFLSGAAALAATVAGSGCAAQGTGTGTRTGTGLGAGSGASPLALRGPGGPHHAPRDRPAPRLADGARDLRKAVKIGMVAEGADLASKFALLKSLGFDGVELDSPADYGTDEVLAARDVSGLRVHGVVDSVHWTKPLSHPDAAVRAEGRAALEGALHHAAAWGASTVLLVPALVNKQVSYAAAWDRSLEQLREVLPLAEDLGVAIALENVWNSFLLSPLEARAYVDELASPALGWYLDVGNLVNFGWPEQWVAVLGDRILKLDVKEFSRARRNAEGLWKGFEVELLEGDCDWPTVMAALDAVGYTGWATAEVPGGDRERLARIAADMDRIFAS